MYEIHITKQQEKIYISEMDDSHLINTVNYYLKDIKKLVDSVSNFKAKKYLFYKSTLALNNDETIQQIIKKTESLYPYAAECALRGLNIQTQMKDTFGRSSKEESKPKIDFFPTLFTSSPDEQD